MPAVKPHPLTRVAEHLHDQHGVEVGYTSPAVAIGARAVESVVHELAHAAVCRISLSDLHVTDEVAARIRDMSSRAADRNEAITLAVELVVLAELGILVRHVTLIRGVEWQGTTWPEQLDEVMEMRDRPSVRRHAAAILCFLRDTYATITLEGAGA